MHNILFNDLKIMVELDPVFRTPRLSSQPEKTEQWDMVVWNSTMWFTQNIFNPRTMIFTKQHHILFNGPKMCICCVHVNVNTILLIFWIQCSTHRDYLNHQEEHEQWDMNRLKEYNVFYKHSFRVWKHDLSHMSHPTCHNPRHSTQDHLTEMNCTNLKNTVHSYRFTKKS